MKKAMRIILIVLGAALVLDTILVSRVSSLHLGVIMPAIIGLPLLILGIFMNPITHWFETETFGKIIKWLMILAYGAFTLLFAVTTTITTVAGLSKPDGNADVLIVLGCSIRGDRVTLTLAKRLDKAAEYLKENPNTTVIVSGGQGNGENMPESVAMRKYLTDKHGIDSDRIITEESSTSTHENFAFSKTIIDSQFGKDAKIEFVTTAFHVFRAEKVAKAAGLDANGIGSSGVWYITLNDYMRECAALVQYTITGKI